MELDQEELRALARFIARRLDPGLVLGDVQTSDPVEAWTTHLQEAQAEGRIEPLIRRVAAEAGDDERLQEACRLLLEAHGATRAPRFRPPRVAIAVAAAALIGLAVFVGPRLGAPPEPEPVRVELSLQPQSISDAGEALAAHAADPTEALASAGYVEAADEAATEALLSVGYVETNEALAAAGYVEPDTITASGSETAAAGDCGTRPGELIGYWYAGPQPPGHAGEVVVVPHSVNVRADYPDTHNHFDARAPVRCVLGAGARVRLSREPIPVPRESWWVPLFSGDVLSDRTG